MRWPIILSILMFGCTHGQRIHEFGPAQGPQGLHGIVSVAGDESELRGELLAVQEDGLVVLDGDRRLVFVAYDRIDDGHFPDAPRLRIGARRAPGPDKRSDLRLLSRYPQGIDSILRERLLNAYRQEAVVELR